ncbi:DUF3619 family protein [Oxalobacter paraformigenes]|uniref:DUF3619 family protein n=1 Tax=Oxalobacter paraformigenes TaxID=556268 RepID=C3X6R0_9BURK|nr:DUF3619 family protein [Oxalobacter paraformigenes]EEO28896.1 hypothetical protein OFAG_02049 [Oxalobacter paraformigenes]
MNMKEENFAYKVRHALNEKLEDMPEHITQRLERARLVAVSRKKKTAPLYRKVFQQVFAGTSGYFSDNTSWMGKLGLGFPILVLVVGMAGIFHHEQQRQIREIADIDIAVLSDELPPSAYADSGFKAYVIDRSGTGV